MRRGAPSTTAPLGPVTFTALGRPSSLVSVLNSTASPCETPHFSCTDTAQRRRKRRGSSRSRAAQAGLTRPLARKQAEASPLGRGVDFRLGWLGGTSASTRMPPRAGPIAAAAADATAGKAATRRAAWRPQPARAPARVRSRIGAARALQSQRVRAHGAPFAARRSAAGRGAAAWRRGRVAHLLKAAEAFRVDGRLVHEDLLAAVVRRDEAEALLRVEPLDLRAGASPQAACFGSRRAAGRVERQCSPNWRAKARPQRHGRRRLPTPRGARAQLAPAERRLPPRDARRARRGSRRGGTTGTMQR